MSSVTCMNSKTKFKTSRGFIIIAALTVLLLSISFISIFLFGKNCSLKFSVEPDSDIIVTFDENIVESTAHAIDGNDLLLDFRSVNTGSTIVMVSCDGGATYQERILYVHSTGIITLDQYFGRCRGDIFFPVSFIFILTLILIRLVRKYRRDTSVSLCRYSNAWLLGVIIFAAFALCFQLLSLVRLSINGDNQSITDLIESTLTSARLFTSLLLPIALVISLAISISNLVLMKHEGVCLQNMLGFFLGIVLCVGTVIPYFIYPLFDSLGIDVHRYSSLTLLLETIIEDMISVIMAYFECILIGTSVSAVRAAKHIPAFNKDFILIHGCQITDDGGLTKLLRSRADRAVEFADMQKKKTGRDIVFVPSGGKGSDEVISEAEAIHNYLISKGIPEERILMEDKSVNTRENLRFSYDLIKERNENANIAFSTTNYHVFRTGCMAYEDGIPAEGIGAKTKTYFWINAFIREFIAALHYEKKSHIRAVLIIIAMMLPTELVVFLSYLL